MSFGKGCLALPDFLFGEDFHGLLGILPIISAVLTIRRTDSASWADPIAALALVPLIAREGWEAVRTSRLGCQCPPI